MSGGVSMAICPKCGDFSGRRKCPYCDIDKIITDIDIADVMAFSPKEEEECINNLINTLIKDTYDPELAKINKERRNKENDRLWGEVASHMSNNTPKCPSCGSTNISKIGTINRAVSTGIFGLASSKIGKTHKCNNCGTTW